MSEKAFRSQLMKVLKPWGAFPCENEIHPGTPDCFIGADINLWIELKKRPTTPKSLITPIKWPHDLRDTQHRWIRKHYDSGGKSLLGLRVGKRTYFVDANWGSQRWSEFSLNDLEHEAIFATSSLEREVLDLVKVLREFANEIKH